MLPFSQAQDESVIQYPASQRENHNSTATDSSLGGLDNSCLVHELRLQKGNRVLFRQSTVKAVGSFTSPLEASQTSA